MTGLEPVTAALPRQCATDCATSAYVKIVFDYSILTSVLYFVNVITRFFYWSFLILLEELRVLKELLDDGIITKEEFDKKKKDILNK